MARKTLPLIQISRKELSVALRRERRARIRTRLLALRAVLDGQTPAAAARAAKTTTTSVERWIQRARQDGLASLLRPQTYARRRNAMAAEQTLSMCAEIAAALAHCPYGRLHSRLRAIDAFLAGQPAAESGAIAQVRPGTLLGWLRFIRTLGITAALARWQAPRGPQRPQLRADPARLRNAMATERTISMRAEIAAALARCPYGRLHSRLRAIDAFLTGQSPAEAAAIAQVRPGTLLGWLRFIRTLGIKAALAQWQAPREPQRPQLRANPARLRAHAAKEKNRHMRKRLLALAYLAEGLGPDDAAIRVRLSDSTVRECRRRFRQGGVAALRSKPYMGGTTKLKPEEIQSVGAVVRANPKIGLNEVCARIESEFGVRYTPAGLKNMLKKQLGIIHRLGVAARTDNTLKT